VEISNRFIIQNKDIFKINPKQAKQNYKVSFGNNSEGFWPDDSLAKAKIALDRINEKPLSFEERMEILHSKTLGEEVISKIMSFDDKEFKEIISYIDMGMTYNEAEAFFSYHKGSDRGSKILDLLKSGAKYSYAVGIIEKEKFDNEKIKTFKKAKFDFSDEPKFFKIFEKDVDRIFQNEDKYKIFCKLLEKGINGNIAILMTELNPESFQKIEEIVDNKEIEFPVDTKCMYAMHSFSANEIKKVGELCKQFNLDKNDFKNWIQINRRRDLDETQKLLEMNVPFDVLPMEILLDDDKIKDAVRFANENKVSLSPVITIMQRDELGDVEKEKSLEYFKNEAIDEKFSMQLARYDDKIALETIEYVNKGLDYNSAIILASYDLKPEEKEVILKFILDGLFKHVPDADNFLKVDIDKKIKDKALELIKLGACIPFALTCGASEEAYQEALDLIESGACEDLDGIYPYNADDFLSQAKLIRLGVPKADLSMFPCIYDETHKELMERGISFETIKKIQEEKLPLINSEVVKDLVKNGIDYEIACKIYEVLPELPFGIETINKVIGDNLPFEKIIKLAQIQKEKQVFKKEDIKLVQAFAQRMDKFEDFDVIYKLGFFNKKALDNFDEITKRGVDKKKGVEILALSQIDFKNTREIDRACELLKRGIKSQYIPYFISDDNEFLRALNDKTNFGVVYGSNIGSIYMAKFAKDGLKLDDIKLICSKYSYNQETLQLLDRYLTKGHDLETAISIANYPVYYNSGTIEQELIDKLDFVSDAILSGCTYEFMSKICGDKNKITKFKNLIKDGIKPVVAEKIVVLEIDKNDKKQIDRVEKIVNLNLNEEFKKNNPNPLMHDFLDELFDFKNYDIHCFKALMDANISVENIVKSARIFVKSPFKQAMKHPNLYLSDIPFEDTEKINGEYPKVSAERMEKYQCKMMDFFQRKITKILRALQYLDVDTFNQMMDKRTSIFGEQLEMLNRMDNEHYELVSKIIKCRKDDGKLLSAKEKIDLSKLVFYHQLGYLDVDYLEKLVEDGKININTINNTVFEKMIDVIGIPPEQIKDIPEAKLEFDKDYMHLLLRTQTSADFLLSLGQARTQEDLKSIRKELVELLELPDEDIIHNGLTREGCKRLLDLVDRMPEMAEKDIYREFVKISPFAHVDCSPQDVAKLAILNDFKDYIVNGDSKFALDNSKTKEKFEELGLNYSNWLNYNEEIGLKLNDRQYNIKMWDRNPQKDLFMGNRTSCCTAVIDGANGKATPIYLVNTAFNVVQIQDENGNIVGMSRIFVSKIDEKPSIVIENIELNNAFLKNKTEEQLVLIRDKMFDYIKGVAKKLSCKDDVKVYFSKNYTHVPVDNYTSQNKNVEFVGDISSDTIYLNCKPGWIEPKKLKDEQCVLYEV